jgi:hypothetical protein
MVHSRFRVIFFILLIGLLFIFFNFHFQKNIIISNTTATIRKIIPEQSKLSPKLNNDLTNSSVLCIIMTSEKTFMDRSITGIY